MTITFLGTGTSCGVPVIGCDCDVCRSSDPKDSRLRASVLVETASTRLLIDCGPDFREQILPQPFRQINGVLLTHIHYDHVGGLDDLRPYCRFGEINVFADTFVSDTLMRTIPYCFAEHRYPGVPAIHLNRIEPHVPLTIGNIDVLPFTVMHGHMPIMAFRMGPLTYITDMKTIDDAELPLLRGTDTLVVNALRFAPDHHSHQTVDEAIAFARRIGARRTLLTHICHDIGQHRQVNASLPADIQLAYDGQTLQIGD